jgi:hypothetical protein
VDGRLGLRDRRIGRVGGRLRRLASRLMVGVVYKRAVWGTGEGMVRLLLAVSWIHDGGARRCEESQPRRRGQQRASEDRQDALAWLSRSAAGVEGGGLVASWWC